MIGVGGFSSVVLFTDPLTKRKYAIKRIPSQFYRAETFLREAAILTKLNHPCVLRIHEWRQPKPATGEMGEIWTEFAENNSLSAVLENAAGGSAPEFWNPTGKAIIICGIVLGMRYVHSQNIIHRDITPSNILINGRGETLIGDFGISCSESDQDGSSSESGTIHYAAPEAAMEKAKLTAKSDVFGFGLVLYEILTGRAVFPSTERPMGVVRRLRHFSPPKLPPEYGLFMQDLCPRCSQRDPSSRPSFDEILMEMEAADFAILPGANAAAVREFALSVLAWESMPE
jgi:serine/threonine protein kinase